MDTESTIVTDAPLADTTPADAAPETPTAGDTGPESGNPDASQAGQLRDPATGRFLPKDGAPDSDDGSAPIPDGNADATAETPDPQAAAPDGAERPESPPVADELPFTVAHRGQEYGVQGARLDPEGHLRVDRETVPWLRNMLASAREYQTVGRQREQHLTRELQARDGVIAARHAGVEALEQAITVGDDVAAVQAFLDLRAKWPELKLNADREALEAERRALRAQPTGTEPQLDEQSAAVQQHVENVTSTTHQQLDVLRQNLPEFKGMSDADVQAVLPELLQNAFVYVREAGPEEEMVHGVPQGTPFFDFPRFQSVAHAIVGPRLAARATQAAQQRAEAARRQASENNKARVAQTTNAPRAATTTVGSAPKADDGKLSESEWRRMKGG